MIKGFFSQTKRKNKKKSKSKKSSDMVICVGSSSKDIFFPTSKGLILETPEDLISQRKFAFELGAKYQVDQRFEALGGCAANVACGLAKLGARVECLTKVGDDDLGEWIQEELLENGVGIEILQIEKKCQSDLSLILVDEKSGEHVIFSDRDANEKLKIYPAKLKKANWLFVSSLNGDWENNLEQLIDFAQKRKIKIAFNPGQKNIAQGKTAIQAAIAKTDLLILNKDEATEVVSQNFPKAGVEHLKSEIFLVNQLRKMGAKTFLLTAGAAGAWVGYEKNIFQAKALLVKALDTTGAGDAFTSGFFGAFVKNKKIEECLAWGVINSSSSVGEYGGQAGLLRENQICKIVKKIKIKKVS